MWFKQSYLYQLLVDRPACSIFNWLSLSISFQILLNFFSVPYSFGCLAARKAASKEMEWCSGARYQDSILSCSRIKTFVFFSTRSAVPRAYTVPPAAHRPTVLENLEPTTDIDPSF